MEPLRIALYSHDSLGLGHVRRNLALAHALTNRLPQLTGRPVTGLLITGTAIAPSFPLPSGWDWVLLPGVAKDEEEYVPRNLKIRMRHIISLRSRLLEAALTGFRPDLIVVDRHAVGIHGELATALRRIRATGASVQIVLGLREILDAPGPAIAEWAGFGGARLVEELFDAVWIYGDPLIHDALRAGEIPVSLRHLIHFTGYLAAGRPRAAGNRRIQGPYILTTVGGGADGHSLASIAAAAQIPAGHSHLIVAGPQMPAEELLELQRCATAGTRVVPMVDDVAFHMRHAAAVVSMGGYNSVCELLSTDVPALIVPRSRSRQEQRIRAESLAASGYLEYREMDTLSPQVLSDWLSSRQGTKVDRRTLRLDGLDTVPRLAANLLDPAREVPAPGKESLRPRLAPSLAGRIRHAAV